MVETTHISFMLRMTPKFSIKLFFSKVSEYFIKLRNCDSRECLVIPTQQHANNVLLNVRGRKRNMMYV